MQWVAEVLQLILSSTADMANICSQRWEEEVELPREQTKEKSFYWEAESAEQLFLLEENVF